jgi:transcriptional regulator with XRE-family HTH domain
MATRTDWSNSSLGERIEHVCALRGWSLNKLGEEAGIASGVMSRLARRTASRAGAPDTLARLADAANINPLWLMLGRGPIERDRRGTLRAHPDWPAALADAKKRQRGIPEEFWDMVGEYPAQHRRIDWQLIVGLVRESYSAHQRYEMDEENAAESEEPTAQRSPRRPTSSKK